MIPTDRFRQTGHRLQTTTTGRRRLQPLRRTAKLRRKATSPWVVRDLQSCQPFSSSRRTHGIHCGLIAAFHLVFLVVQPVAGRASLRASARASEPYPTVGHPSQTDQRRTLNLCARFSTPGDEPSGGVRRPHVVKRTKARHLLRRLQRVLAVDIWASAAIKTRWQRRLVRRAAVARRHRS